MGGSAGDVAVEVSGLSKLYGERVALDGVSFAVRRGEVVGLLGPNGAGKSTTMRIMSGCIPPSGGRVRVAGFDVVEQPLEVKRRIGYLPEVPPLYPDLTVREQLVFASALKGIPRSRASSEVAGSAERTGCGDVLDRLVGNLSRGYRQRVGLAQALLGDPEVLILDEPTAGLDPRQIGEVRQLVRELAAERTVVVSTHILQEVVAVCQRVLIIARGKIVADDRLDSLVDESGGRSLESIFLELTAA